MLPTTTALCTQQLAEFLAVVSAVPDPLSAVQMTTERAAKALEAEVAAIVGADGTVVDLVGFRTDAVPGAELAEVARGRRLRNVEDLHEIADAQLPLAKDVQDAQARPIGKGLEQSVHGFRRAHGPLYS